VNGGLDIVLLVARRSLLAVLRRPVVLTFSLGQPLIWMAFFGFLFQRYPLHGLPRDIAYPDFLAPGVAVMAVLFGASQSGIAWIRDLQTGFLPRMLATPADARLILLGKLLADAFRLTVQAMLVLGLALLLGVQAHPDPAALGLAFLNLLLFAAAFSALSCAIALRVQAQEAMATFVHLVNMPLLFTSTALAPARQMPDWLAQAAAINPLTAVVEALRHALLFGECPPSPLAGLALSALLAGLLFALAAAQMRYAAGRY